MKAATLRIKKTGIIIFWLLVWEFISLLLSNEIILVGPTKVIRALLTQMLLPDFWKTILLSSGKISLGFLLAFTAGIFIGGVAFRFSFLEKLLEPVIVFFKSVPVASFVILALIWVGSRNLSILIAFLVVFPIIYISTLSGLRNADPKLLEMAKVFRIPVRKKLLYLYCPALLPYLESSCHIALGMCWKSGIAAEVIGVPDHSIGEKLYMAKIYLSTADLFAWTAVIILISALFEKLFLRFLFLAKPGAISIKRRHFL